MNERLLAIDLGTQSVRALLFTPAGELVGRVQQPFTDYRREHPGWMTHDGEAFWQAAAACCKRLWAEHDPGAVAGVAVTTQRGTIVPVDAQGRCLASAIIWPDQRRATRVPPVAWPWRAAFTAIGLAGTLRALQQDAEVNWWAEHEPQLHARAERYLLMSGLLNQRLTGRMADSVGAQVAYLPFDGRAQAWARAGSWPWQALAVQPRQLAELVPVGAQLGSVTTEAALATGLREGTPVLAAAADKACEVLGAGALAPHVGALSYGTTATINITSARYLEAVRLIPPYPAAVPGHYSVEVQVTRGFWLVSWFKEQFGLFERQLALQRGVAPETLFDELVNAVPPGSLGLMLQPFWNPGIKVPGPEAKGAIIGFGDVHNRAHLYRAILEGLAYALREARERIERRSGRPITRLRVSGGGSQSDAAMQITANIFNLPCERPHLYETSGLGAAMLAAVSLKLHPDFATAVARMTRIGAVFEPQPEHARTYDRLYRRIYCRMYRRLQPLYRDIQVITGYPARLDDDTP